jgi:hypothetical protein
MSKLFKYLNLNEADIKLLDPETMQMGQVVDIMQKTYMGAPDGRKKDTLANMIAETVALVLARVNSIKGLSKDAKKKIEEEAKELPKAPEMPKEAPKEQPKQEEAPKEEKNPFEVGQVWMNKVIDKKMEVLKVEPETDTLEFGIFYNKSKDYAYYSLELGIEKVKIKDWVLIEEEQEAPKEEPKPQAPPPQDNPMPEDEPETEEEIREAIQGLNILAKMGDNDVKIEIKRLKAKLKKK